MLLIFKKYIYLFLVLFKFECKIKDFSVLPTFGFDILAMSFGKYHFFAVITVRNYSHLLFSNEFPILIHIFTFLYTIKIR